MPACVETKSLEDRWESLPSRARLPFRWDVYARQSQADWQEPESQRRSPRTALRSLAIMVRGSQPHAVYAKDVSQTGLGFFSPIRLKDGETIWLELPGRRLIPLRVTRCKEMSDRCFICGATFAPTAAD